MSAGYQLKAAPIDAWRNYDEHNPMPGYFQFDWLSASHPDLYHKFALTTIGLMNELNRLVDLPGLQVVEVGAGTGRSAIEAGRKAQRVTAIDIFESVVPFGNDMVHQAGFMVDRQQSNSWFVRRQENAKNACGKIQFWAFRVLFIMPVIESGADQCRKCRFE